MPFLMTFFINNDRWWWGIMLSWQWVISCWVQERYMLHWVIFHRIRELQLVGIRRNHFNDFIRSKATMIQFAAWSLCSNVLCIEPDFVTYLEYRCRLTLSVGILLLSILCLEDLDRKSVV